ncbi:hypothetical protein SAMN04490244_102214 [Tranquillimonas rosea]|uniref:PAS domain-containing protein n=1 Tax=Tranquillimonas rosea TaxID=641238 RepID=A0A1H9RCM7_9RHOB|nr:PAS domain-containing protein [Tranquillimonas rosea]SER70450.1 hypothetical protein SAMN04490244_102214 [Tranquillimonas rosea]
MPEHEAVADRLPKVLEDYFESSTVALSLADVSQEDLPLILANSSFYTLTGYGSDDVIGQNCRFLQGPDTTEDSLRDVRDFIADDETDSGRFPIVNYRKDGTRFHNFVFMSRLRRKDGSTRFILASQFDMTSAMDRVKLRRNDEQLSEHLRDIDLIGKEYGLAMMGSARILADSVAMLARLSLDSDDAT